MNEDRYTNVILEEMRGQIQAVFEIVVGMQEQVQYIPAMKEDIAELKTDIKIIKQAVKDTNADLRLLDRRVTKLENAS
ncbi:MAG TPA: hypothetical protein PKD19_02095 [Candidatus Saccharibacteria bacterium]|nr:hypothetical protein [Candidatus Saccharibacteria bacterium]HMR38376.1 hypothetical protein [Candidatus Saccharibacteria bacterium]